MNYLHSETTGLILKAFFNVYNGLGYGFLEKVYERAMILELNSLGLKVEEQKKITVFYKDEKVGDYFADLIINDQVIIELKAVERIAPEHEVQLVNYLKATNIQVGLLLNFGAKPQYKRKVFTKNYHI
ncbi:GxxExxY protein [Labilibaculum sp.]|uniref:GxxExxY protein n=1 Tax=Labilibaculum sp. TaxID=2060723 RepID=UPI00356AEA68